MHSIRAGVNNHKGTGALYLRSAVFIVVLAITLAFGLWPFKFFPENNATLASNGRSVELSGWSMAVPSLAGQNGHGEISLSLAPRALRLNQYLGRILTLYDAKTGEDWLLIGQWRSDFIVRLYHRDEVSGNRSYGERGTDGAFSGKRPVRLRVSYSGEEISVVADTTRLFNKKGWRGPERGSWIAGISPFGTDPWPGSIRSEQDGPGRAAAIQWTIPPRFKPPFRHVLEPPERGEMRTMGFIVDAIVNCLGFLPFGFFFILLFGKKENAFHAGTVAAVALASLGLTLAIELVQTTIPFRTSQLSDVVLNTMGGTLGGVLGMMWKKRSDPGAL